MFRGPSSSTIWPYPVQRADLVSTHSEPPWLESAYTLLVFTTNRLFRKLYKCMKFVEEELIENGHRCIFLKGIDGRRQRVAIASQVHGMLDEMATTMYAENIPLPMKGYSSEPLVSTLPFGYCGRDVDGPPTKLNRPRQEVAVRRGGGMGQKIFHWFLVDRLPMAHPGMAKRCRLPVPRKPLDY